MKRLMPMRKALVVALVLLLGTLAVPLLPQPVAALSYVTLATNAATDLDYFWATLNGEVTAIIGCDTLYVGFVLSPVSHGDPGNIEPYNSAYGFDEGGRGEAWYDAQMSPFSWDYGSVGSDVGAYLLPNTKYYYRACIYADTPLNTWKYGSEVTFTTPLNPEGTWGSEGWIYNSYAIITTENVTMIGQGMAVLPGSGAWSDGVHTQWLGGDGFVYDTQSHANPSGWPDSWTDVSPYYCDYPNYVSIYPSIWDGSGEPYFTFDYLLSGLDPDTTYYYRAVGNIEGGGDWVYGPEESFTTGGCCAEQDSLYGLPNYGDIWYDLDPLSSDIWGAVNVAPGWFPSYSKSTDKAHFKPLAYSLPDSAPAPVPAYTPDHITVNTVSLLLYRSGTVSALHVAVYLADDYTWYPVGLPLATGTADVSTLTTDPNGDWVTVSLSSSVTMDGPNIYDVVAYSDGYFDYPDQQNCVVWVSSYDPDESRYMDSYDDGSDWSWPGYDACYVLWDCASPAAPAASLFEAWGYTPSTKPLWYQAWPSILKVLYLGAVILAAIFAYRQQPRPQYPDTPDMPDMSNMTG